MKRRAADHHVGILLNLHAFWVGFHYSKWNGRLCV